MMTETEREVIERIRGEHADESEHRVGQRVDSFFGLRRKMPVTEPHAPAPKPFPVRALRNGPGEVPII